MLTNPVTRGALWMLGMVVSLSSIAIAARELNDHISAFEMIFFRGLFGLVVLTLWFKWEKGHLPKTDKLPTHIIRNVSHYLGQYAWFYGIAFLTLAEVFAIEFTTPIWTVLLAALLLKERITRWRMLTLCLGITGVLIILRPGFITVEFASLVVVASALCFANSHIYTRKLTQHESPTSILFYMNVIQVPIALIPALLNWVTPQGIDWFWLTLMGISSITAHYCLSRALTIADASIMIPIDYLRLPLIVLVGYVFYQEGLDIYVLIGAGIIIAGNLITLRKEARSH